MQPHNDVLALWAQWRQVRDVELSRYSANPTDATWREYLDVVTPAWDRFDRALMASWFEGLTL